ncbi:MAG TPA: hypothetical protein VHO46_15195, partial [Bacteroidales bacterium]|nr:hypothetical protein [Bacteroidales bacterium]
DIPANLVNSKIYELIILKKPVGSGSIDDNLSRNQVNLTTKDPEDSLSIATTDITATRIEETETVLHSFSFRSSKYSTFSEKLTNIKGWRDTYSVDDFEDIKTYMSLLFVRGDLEELFDNYEMNGTESIEPLISLEAITNVNWISSHAYPLVYELYGTGGLTLNRNVSSLGLFPSKAIFLENMDLKSLVLSESNSVLPDGKFRLRYYIPAYVNYDFYELRDKAASMYVGTASMPEQAVRLLAGTLKDIPLGDYPFRISYKLPGNKVTFSKDFFFKNYSK